MSTSKKAKVAISPSGSPLDVPETTISEGSAKIVYPPGEVFYNPVQQFNRDLSVAVLNCFQKKYLGERNTVRKKITKLRILEALSASGLRSIRYAKEVPNVEAIFANDLDPKAVEFIRRNVANNDVPEGVIVPNQGDANSQMHRLAAEHGLFDVIDLDPYGSAAPFLDSAMQTIADGGLLCITCTDLGVLCGSHPETCFAKYGALSVRGDSCHEMALRVILAALETSSTRHKKIIVPLISCSVDFYVRLFVRVFASPEKCKFACTVFSRRSLLLKCVGCKSFYVQPLAKSSQRSKSDVFQAASGLVTGDSCPICSSRMSIGGPFWSSSIHDQEFVAEVLAFLEDAQKMPFGSMPRMKGVLSVILEEIDVPLFLSISELSSAVRTSCPSLIEMRSALLNAGYMVSISHTDPTAIKTNAPMTFLWEIMRAWALKQGVASEKLGNGTPGKHILAQPPSVEVSFKEHKDAIPNSKRSELVRFQENPTKNWGPMCRAR